MSTVAPVVVVKDLVRRFEQVDAVRGLSFTVRPGQVVGFIGANGAGKTTTMRMLVGLDTPTSGEIFVGGYDIVHYPERVRRRLGWMPDAYGTYDHTTVLEYLDFFARSFGYRGADRVARVREVMEFTDLTELATREIDQLSKGMGQRLCLGRMLLHDPDVLVMDEPAAGLDPKARVEFKRLVKLLKDENKAIFISSHILSELDDMCDTILFINHGEMVHHGATSALKQEQSGLVTYDIRAVESPAEVAEWIKLSPGVSVLESDEKRCSVRFESDDPELIAQTLRRMLHDGLRVLDFHRRERRLEEAFIEVLEQSTNRRDRKGGSQ